MIDIKITGDRAVGKTHIAALIQQTLESHGIRCTLINDDNSKVFRQLQERVTIGMFPYGIKRQDITITDTSDTERGQE
jgi:hypothetical protein